MSHNSNKNRAIFVKPSERKSNMFQLEDLDTSTRIGKMTKAILSDNIRAAKDMLSALETDTGIRLLQKEAVNKGSAINDLYNEIEESLCFYTPDATPVCARFDVYQSMQRLGFIGKNYIDDERWVDVLCEQYNHVADMDLLISKEQKKVKRLMHLSQVKDLNKGKLDEIEKDVDLLLSRYNSILSKKKKIKEIDGGLTPAQKVGSFISGFKHSAKDDRDIYESADKAESLSVFQDIKNALTIMEKG